MSKQELVCCTSLQAAPLDEDRATELAEAESGVCVCELTPAFDLSQPTISHHLKLLRQAGLVDSERRGTWVYYWLRPEVTDTLAALLARPASEWAEQSAEGVKQFGDRGGARVLVAGEQP